MNGRRAWRKAAKREQRRAVGQDFYWTHDACGNVAAYGRRHLKNCWTRPPARAFTPRSLVGMSQRRRKALFHVEFDAAREKDGAVSMFVADALLSKYRIGQRLRPCLGCQYCKANPWQMLIAVARLNHLAVKIGRFIPKRDGQMFLCGITVARHCVHFPERTIQVGGGGQDATMHEARQAAATDVLINLRRRYDGLLWAKCDGSGVLPAIKEKQEK